MSYIVRACVLYACVCARVCAVCTCMCVCVCVCVCVLYVMLRDKSCMCGRCMHKGNV